MAATSVGDVGPILLAGAVTLFTTLVGWIAYKLKPAEKNGDDVAVVSATFADKKLMQQLLNALEATNVELVELNMHLRNAEQRRHDEEVVRLALKQRGILE